jgi:hypothetical protein
MIKWKCKKTGSLHEEVSQELNEWTGVSTISIYPAHDGRTVYSSVEIHKHLEKLDEHKLPRHNR